MVSNANFCAHVKVKGKKNFFFLDQNISNMSHRTHV